MISWEVCKNVIIMFFDSLLVLYFLLYFLVPNVNLNTWHFGGNCLVIAKLTIALLYCKIKIPYIIFVFTLALYN